MKQYKHLFFDLDKTLWDFTANTIDTFEDLFLSFDLKNKGVPDALAFYNTYEIINDELWMQYRSGIIGKKFLNIQRFHLTLKTFSVENISVENISFAETIADEYVRLSPLKTKLIEGTHDVLHYLSGKYPLHIITNGFNEVQYAKLERCDLRKYFDKIITSEDAKFHKPAKGIFDFALESATAVASESLMIGDDIVVDVLGARNAGIDQVYVNLLKTPNNIPATFQVSCLKDLTCFL